jgi:vacuolar-type H+-ATPase subunit C/Vma6
MRQSLKAQDLSFTEIAKIVGEKWQLSPAEAREPYQRQANAGKENYHAELAEYKKFSQYDAYQKYLREFKAEHSSQYNGSSCSRFLCMLAHI